MIFWETESIVLSSLRSPWNMTKLKATSFFLDRATLKSSVSFILNYYNLVPNNQRLWRRWGFKVKPNNNTAYGDRFVWRWPACSRDLHCFLCLFVFLGKIICQNKYLVFLVKKDVLKVQTKRKKLKAPTRRRKHKAKALWLKSSDRSAFLNLDRLSFSGQDHTRIDSQKLDIKYD